MPFSNFGSQSPPYTSTEETRKQIAWGAATATLDINERIDCDGRRIRWSEYGKLTEYGWEIDHAAPLALGGLDGLGNLRARHYRGNRSAGGILGSLIGDGPFKPR